MSTAEKSGLVRERIAIAFIYTQAPETRGRTLEEVEDDVTTGAISTHHLREEAEA
ncbi:hypothetical protein [Gordonia sp. SL306]|uniref:hypothetical protein n=1 Tax=Gordonia sp. SL306 TaxID=2995145 RepID=UPI00226F89D4|nr:hypothetical protein [Gordonia sp. SL306]WAC56391.1 hypothetical protein OVA31_03770 [Gordonia sp. SL306]